MQIIVNIFFSFSIILLLVSSFNIIYYTAKIFHIAHASIITLGAYIAFLFSNQFGFPILISIVFSIVISIVIGLCSELFIYKSLRNRDSHSLVYLISSLGIYVILQNAISLIWGDATLKLRLGNVQVGHEIYGVYLTNLQIITIGVSLLVFILLTLFYKYALIGRHIRAVASNSLLANVFGINSNNVILWTFIIGSGIAAVAGILIAFDINMRPTMGFNLLIYAVVAMIIGGVGSTWGIFGSALLLSTTQHIGAYFIGGIWMDVIAYVVLILFMLWKPYGFCGQKLKKNEI